MWETLYVVVNMLAMFVSFACCADMVMEKPSVNQKYLMLICICGFITTVGNAMEVFAYTEEVAIAAIKVAYIGKCYIMLFSLLFVGNYCRVRLPKLLIGFHGIANSIILSLIMSPDKHKLYYKSYSFETRINGRIAIIPEAGILYYMWLALFIASILIYVFIAAQKVKNSSKILTLRLNMICLTAIVPFVCALLFIVLRPPNYDPTSLSVMFVEICIFVAVRKYGLLYTIEIAQESFLENNNDGLVILDSNKKEILYANAAARNIFFEQNKITEEEVIGWISSDERQNENVLEINGRHYETRISEIKQSEKNNMIQGYMVWIFDMTFLDRYTNEMIRLKEESEQANKAKTNFLAHMSHEIRTPMNSIVGYSELALIGKDELLIHGYLKHIKDSAHTLLRLINEMLDISKIESGKMEMVNVQYSLSKLVNEIRYMMEAQAGKVEDRGIGIKEENFSKVFGKFEQFDKKENYNIEGTGLGLAIVKSFVEMMGGDISFVSEYGKGTKFMVNLWQEIGEKEKTESAVYEENSANGVPEINPGRILVVDDNKLNCDVTQGILELLGMDTQITYSGADCIKKLEDGENYDLIFMDHMMPEMDGVETLDRIRNMGEEFKTLPVVLLTANAVSGIKEQMIDRGFDDYLSKPIDVDELQHVLVRFLGCKG